jgi:ABC-type transport system involved in multi-copper enzyme maturation permease subunit
VTGFGEVLHAEWTKFRTVRGWVIGLIIGAILMAFLGVFLAGAASIGCVEGNVQKTGRACLPYIPIGPGGEAVEDSFYFVREQLDSNGSITARLTSLTSLASALSGGPSHVHAAGPPSIASGKPALVPWAKAGVMIKASLKRGSAYAAMLVTGSHGVRFQYDYTGDIAGLPGRVSAASPRWLRLTRAGDTITGYDSLNGTAWIKVGTVTLTGLPRTVQIGLLTTSPQHLAISDFFGGLSVQGGPTTSTSVLDDVRLTGARGIAGWTGDNIGARSPAGLPVPPGQGGYREAAGTFTITGSGDIAPIVPGPGNGGYPTTTVEQSLTGAFAALIAIIVVAAMYFTTEYRRGLIRTTLAATPLRGQVLAAKAIVAGAVAFVTGLVASVFCVALGVPRQEAQGQFLLPVSVFTEARVIVGTAALLAVMAVLAVALGGVLRRGATAITIGVVGIVLPFLFAVTGVFPAGVTAWLLRLTPAAGFAIEQSIPHYQQVSTIDAPGAGYYPLTPWAGFAVLLAWAAAVFVLALIQLRRRDA